METYRQPIRINNRHVTMVGLVSDLTGIVRGYYRNWRRPLAENREDLQRARQLGDRIVRVAVQRPWREDALQDVLGALQIQDNHMYQLVSHLLTDVRVTHTIEEHKDLQNQLFKAFEEEDTGTVWETSRDLYRLSHQTLAFIENDPANLAAFCTRLHEVKKEDVVMYNRITFTLNEVAALRQKHGMKEIPKPRSKTEFVVYKNNILFAARMRRR